MLVVVVVFIIKTTTFAKWSSSSFLFLLQSQLLSPLPLIVPQLTTWSSETLSLVFLKLHNYGGNFSRQLFFLLRFRYMCPFSSSSYFFLRSLTVTPHTHIKLQHLVKVLIKYASRKTRNCSMVLKLERPCNLSIFFLNFCEGLRTHKIQISALCNPVS